MGITIKYNDIKIKNMIRGERIMNYWLQALKLIIGLLFLTTVLRGLGRQNLSQLTPYDIVYIIVLGGVLDGTFYDDDIGLLPFIFSAIVWTISIYIIEISVKRYDFLRIFFRGKPEHILKNGKLNMHIIEKNNLEMEQIRMLLRKDGIFSLEEVKDIYLEIDGTLSLIKYKDYQGVTNSNLGIKLEEDYPNILLIDDGKIEIEALKYINKTTDWLKGEMDRLGIYDISNIIYCEWSQRKGFYYKTKDDVLVIKKNGHAN